MFADEASIVRRVKKDAAPYRAFLSEAAFAAVVDGLILNAILSRDAPILPDEASRFRQGVHNALNTELAE